MGGGQSDTHPAAGDRKQSSGSLQKHTWFIYPTLFKVSIDYHRKRNRCQWHNTRWWGKPQTGETPLFQVWKDFNSPHYDGWSNLLRSDWNRKETENEQTAALVASCLYEEIVCVKSSAFKCFFSQNNLIFLLIVIKLKPQAPLYGTTTRPSFISIPIILCVGRLGMTKI